MNFYKIDTNVIVGYSKNELAALFKGYIISHLPLGLESISELKVAIDVVSKKIIDRDNHEIFIASFIILNFFESGSEVCFQLKNFNLLKDKINSLSDLNKFREDPPDFIIKYPGGYEFYELKRYKNKIGTDELFGYIKKVIQKYGNDFGDTNIIFLIQPDKPYMRVKIDFQKLHQNIKLLNYKFNGQILLLWNENCKEQFTVQLYPKLSKQVIEFRFPSQQLYDAD